MIDWVWYYRNLCESSSYTAQNAANIIEAYSRISIGNQHESIFQLEKDPQINRSLTLIKPLIPQLSSENLAKLCGTLPELNPSHLIWGEIENQVLKKITKFNDAELNSLINGFSMTQSKNTKLWENLEVLVKGYLLKYPNASISILTSWLCCFTSVSQGSHGLFSVLITGMLNSKEKIRRGDIDLICTTFLKSKTIDPSVLNLVVTETIKDKNEFIPFYKANVLALLAKFQGDADDFEAIEESIKQYLHRLSDGTLYVPCYAYGKYLEDEIKMPGKRQEFLLEIERYLYNKRESLFHGNLDDEFKLMWGISKTDVFECKELWSWYLKKIYGKFDNLSSPELTEFLKKMQEKGFME